MHYANHVLQLTGANHVLQLSEASHFLQLSDANLVLDTTHWCQPCGCSSLMSSNMKVLLSLKITNYLIECIASLDNGTLVTFGYLYG